MIIHVVFSPLLVLSPTTFRLVSNSVLHGGLLVTTPTRAENVISNEHTSEKVRATKRNLVQMTGGELCIMNKISPRTSFEMTIVFSA